MRKAWVRVRVRVRVTVTVTVTATVTVTVKGQIPGEEATLATTREIGMDKV